jgi:hypothetical protein
MSHESENNEDEDNVEVGIEEIIIGGLYKAASSDGFATALLAIAEAYRRASKDQYDAHYESIKEMLVDAAESFPFEVDIEGGMEHMAECGAGLILAANTFEFATEGFAELVIVRRELQQSDKKFRSDNA